MNEIELNSLDLRYEDLRLKDGRQESLLLASIIRCGIENPLEGVDAQGVPILLDGFKRYRCARKLNLHVVPFVCVAQSVSEGMLNLLRGPHRRPLDILEEAALVDELKNLNHLAPAEIAKWVRRSKTWVNTRLGLLDEMSEPIRRDLFDGAFSVCAYMQTLRPMMRKKEVGKTLVETFIHALRHKELSVRQIKYLADGYFLGPPSFREQIDQGHIQPMLNRIECLLKESPNSSPFEHTFLKELERLDLLMAQVMGKALNKQLKSDAFMVQAQILLARIKSRALAFFQTIGSLYDRCTKA